MYKNLCKKILVCTIVILFIGIGMVPMGLSHVNSKILDRSRKVQNAFFLGEPIEEWNKSFGGPLFDYGLSVQQTADGGYIIVGIYEINRGDIWLIKTDGFGNKLWDKTYGGDEYDEGKSVQQTNDGGYIIVGVTYSYGESGDIWLIKTDSFGNILWNTTFGGSLEDFGWSVQQSFDEGFIIAGYTRSFGAGNNDVWLIKTNRFGDKVWDKTFGGGADDNGYSMQQTSDGGYVITGKTLSYGYNGDVWLIKVDSQGNMLWEKTFGGSETDGGFSVKQTNDGGYIVAGFTRSNELNDVDVLILKTDTNGNMVWETTFGGSGLDAGWDVQQTYDGGYVVTGVTMSYNVGDAYLIKTDENGDILWNKIFGGSGFEHAYSIEQTLDAGFIVTGCTESYGAGGYDVWLVKFADFTSPNVSLVKPVSGMLYFGNKSCFSLPWTVIIGKVMVEVMSEDLESGIEKVEFYVDDILYNTSTVPPYQWFWEEPGFGTYTLKVVAYDYAGNSAFDKIKVWKFF